MMQFLVYLLISYMSIVDWGYCRTEAITGHEGQVKDSIFFLVN